MLRTPALSASALALLLGACAAFPPETSDLTRNLPPDGSLEVALSSSGRVLEVEFHVPPGQLPAAILAAAREVVGEPLEAEIEFHGRTRFYEVTGKRVDGTKIEAMFDAEGRLHSLEIQVPRDEVPPEVVRAAEAWGGGGSIRSWEKILDGQEVLQAWHVKSTVAGRKLKLIFGADGALVEVRRETPAEIEVPIFP